jgi:transposase
VFLDESGYMLNPTVRRTYAPRGETPILKSWDRRDRISAIGAITVSPKRQRFNLFVNLLGDDANACAADTVRFLRQLHRHIRGPLTLVWDRGNIHDRAGAVRGYLARHPEIAVEQLPAYAPELNPEELVWQHTKYSRLANFAASNTVVLRRKLAEEFRTLSQQPELLRSFVKHAGFPLKP